MDKFNSNLHKYLNLEKRVENKMINSYKYYDKNGKKIMKEVMAQDKKNQNFLNKSQDTKYLIFNNNYHIKKLNKEFSKLGADILSTKKKYKGLNAIEPESDAMFFHKLIIEKMMNKLNDDEYLKEVSKIKNIESMSNKIKKRMLILQQKSRSIKNKIKESDYSYL